MDSENLLEHQLKEVFELIDVTSSGYLSLDQLECLGKKHFLGNEEVVAQLIRCLDPKGIGKLTYHDFCQRVTSVINESISGEPNRGSRKTSPLAYQNYVVKLPFNSCEDEYDVMSKNGNHLLDETDSAVATLSDVSTGTGDKRDSSSPSLSEGEERFECYGEAEENEQDHTHLTPAHTKAYLSSDSFRSTSSAGSVGSGRMKTPSHGFQPRNSWQRTSGSGRRLSTHFLTNQLPRSSSFNSHQANNNQSSSRRSSVSYDSDDMYTDGLSLEDDVSDLNHKVQLLQQQVSALSESQSGNEDKYSRVKQENVHLTARIHSLEEQIRELEIRSEQRLEEEQANLRETMSRQERLKSEEAVKYSNQIFNLQQENLHIKEEALQLKVAIEKIKLERLQLQEKLADTLSETSLVKDENRRLQELARREQEEYTKERSAMNLLFKEVSHELEDLRGFRQRTEISEKVRVTSIPSHYLELEHELKKLRQENHHFKNANEELQAQLVTTGLQEGHHLLQEGNVSLAVELENLSKDEVTQKLTELTEENRKLRLYIDGILLNIMENHPQLLEVKPPS